METQELLKYAYSKKAYFKPELYIQYNSNYAKIDQFVSTKEAMEKIISTVK